MPDPADDSSHTGQSIGEHPASAYPATVPVSFFQVVHNSAFLGLTSLTRAPAGGIPVPRPQESCALGKALTSRSGVASP